MFCLIEVLHGLIAWVRQVVGVLTAFALFTSKFGLLVGHLILVLGLANVWSGLILTFSLALASLVLKVVLYTNTEQRDCDEPPDGRRRGEM